MHRSLIILFCIVICSCEQGNLSTIAITLEREKYGKAEGKWLYLYAIDGNEYLIADSCMVKNLQCKLRSNLPDELPYYLLVPATENQYEFWMKPGDHLNVSLTSEITRSRLSIPGTLTNMAHCRLEDAIEKQTKIWLSLKDSLAKTNIQNPIYKILEDSIHRVDVYRRQKLLIEMLDDKYIRQSPHVSDLIVMFLDTDGYPSEQLDSIRQVLLERFPNDHYRMHNCTGESVSPASDRSIATVNRILHIMGFPPIEKRKKTTTCLPDNYITPKAYQKGDVINIHLFDTFETKTASLAAINSPYILLDFWASWCSPCCDEIPNILKIKEAYPDLLSVYAVSLDYWEDVWQEALDKYEIRTSFSHVMLPKSHKQYQYIIDKFAINAIPANILLDKKRRIISFNLHGDALAEKIKELANSDIEVSLHLIKEK